MAQNRVQEANGVYSQLISYQYWWVEIGNGTASRETEAANQEAHHLSQT